MNLALTVTFELKERCHLVGLCRYWAQFALILGLDEADSPPWLGRYTLVAYKPLVTQQASFTWEGQPTLGADETNLGIYLTAVGGLRRHQRGCVGVCSSWDTNGGHSWFAGCGGLPDRLQCRRWEREQLEGSPAATESKGRLEQPSSTSRRCKQEKTHRLYHKKQYWGGLLHSTGAPIVLGRCPSPSAHESESMLRTYLVCREKQANGTWEAHSALITAILLPQRLSWY
jgi:hypothetical protein